MSAINYRKELTNQIIEQLEAGTAPWIKPWNPDLAPIGSPHNAVTGRPYQGGNHLWLSCQSYADNRWCTYRQAQEQGWQVRKNERSTSVEYWQWTEKKKDEHGKIVEVKLDQPRVFFAHLFNAAQLEGIGPQPAIELPWKPEEAAERIIQASGADIRHDQSNRAFYSPLYDTVHLPLRLQFPDSQRYYATVLHEIGHWAEHPSRLNHDLSHSFGTPGYARGELRAELASYFLSSRIGIGHDPSQHASYISSWIDLLRRDHHEIFRAAKDAEKITEYVLGFALEKNKEHGLGTENESQATKPLPINLQINTTQPPKVRRKERELEC